MKMKLNNYMLFLYRDSVTIMISRDRFKPMLTGLLTFTKWAVFAVIETDFMLFRGLEENF